MLTFRVLIAVLALSAVGRGSAGDFDIVRYGAKGDGKCTAAFAAAVRACSAAGGGRVVVPSGKWFTGAIRLASDVELHLSDGAEVVFSQDPDDYLPAVHTSWEGMECWNYCPLVYAYCCTNVAITGTGTLRAFEGTFEKSLWKDWVPQENGIRESRRQLYDWSATDCPVERRQIWKRKNAHTRPHFVQFNRCRNVRWEGFKVRNSPFWTLHLYLCDGVIVRGLDVRADGSNNDGIDIEMSRNVLVERCSFDQRDDTFVLKSGRNRDGWRIGVPTENVEIRDCHMSRAHSFFCCGSEISGGVRNVYFHDCSVGTAGELCYIKTNRRRGAFVENIRCENIRADSCINAVAIGTDVLYEWAKFPDYEIRTTRIGGLSFKNIHCKSAERRIDVVGDAKLPIDGLVLENVRADTVRTGDRLVNAVNVVEDGRAPVLRTCPAVGSACIPDTRALLASYVRGFNADDEELYTNAFPNAAAETFLLRNVPRFACPDKVLEKTYYFRWWTFRKHLRNDGGRWKVTEFLPKVPWSGKDNTIVCPAGHHLREGRWLRDPRFIEDCARFWLSDPEAVHRWQYASWLFTGTRLFAEVSGRDSLPGELLEDAVRYYERWERGFRRRGIPMGGDGKGGFLSIDNYEGTELSLGGNGYKPLFSSAMWSEANAIAEVASQRGLSELAAKFAAKADVVRQSVLDKCWNPDVGFFTTCPTNGPKGIVRELHGYAPWYFGMPTDGRMPDWAQLSDPQGFAAACGLTFPERRAKGFVIDYAGHECKWNGPSWPFATSIALTALANDIHGRHRATSLDRGAFVQLLHRYAEQHALRRADGKVVPWIDENLHPDTGEWLARKIILDTPAMREFFPRERGKDYNHSTFCDLVISGLVGLIPNGGKGFAVDPLFPAEWDYLVLENLRYRGHDIDIRWTKAKGLSVAVDGREAAQRADWGRIEIVEL